MNAKWLMVHKGFSTHLLHTLQYNTRINEVKWEICLQTATLLDCWASGDRQNFIAQKPQIWILRKALSAVTWCWIYGNLRNVCLKCLGGVLTSSSLDAELCASVPAQNFLSQQDLGNHASQACGPVTVLRDNSDLSVS